MRKIGDPYLIRLPAVVLVLIAAATAAVFWAAPSATGIRPPKAAQTPPAGQRAWIEAEGQWQPTATNDWLDRLSADRLAANRRGRPPQSQRQGAPPAGLTRIATGSRTTASHFRKFVAGKPRDDGEDDEINSPWTSEESRGAYRTLCVRMCDGYYFPISFATSQDNLERDARVCERSCASPARLFFHENPGQPPEEMEDARGKRYKDLKVAFRHRKLYDEACTCKAQPWDEAALARHRQFAATAERKKSGRKGEASPTRIGRIDQTGSGAPGSATTAAGVAMLVAPVDLPLPSAAERRAEKLAAITRSLPRAKEQADSGWIGRWQPMLPAGLQALGEKRRQSLVPARVPRPETAMRRTWPRDQSPLDAGRVPRQSRPLPIPAPAQSAAEGPVPAARGAPAAAKTSGQRTSARARATPAVAVRPAGRAPRKLADGSETHVQ